MSPLKGPFLSRKFPSSNLWIFRGPRSVQPLFEFKPPIPVKILARCRNTKPAKSSACWCSAVYIGYRISDITQLKTDPTSNGKAKRTQAPDNLQDGHGWPKGAFGNVRCTFGPALVMLHNTTPSGNSQSLTNLEKELWRSNPMWTSIITINCGSCCWCLKSCRSWSTDSLSPVFAAFYTSQVRNTRLPPIVLLAYLIKSDPKLKAVACQGHIPDPTIDSPHIPIGSHRFP